MQRYAMRLAAGERVVRLVAITPAIQEDLTMQTTAFFEAESTEVLVVEDSDAQAEILRYILTAHGYRVAVAHTGTEALAVIRQRRPTLVLSDISMPEMDGYELCRQLKQDQCLNSLPIILLTALADPVDVVRGLECGADNFVVKPYEAPYLLSQIAYTLANQHLCESPGAQMGVEIVFAGQRFCITSDRLRILNLLLSTYETAVQKNLELARVQVALQELNEQLEVKVHERTAALEAEIAERKRAEEALRESEEQYRELFENANEILYTCDLAGNFTSLNNMGEQITGYSRAEVLTMHLTHLVASEYRPLVQRLLAARGTEATTCEFDICTKDGRTVRLEGSTRVIYRQGQAVGLQGIARDITKRRLLEQQLRQAQKMEAVGCLAGGVAHDFNNLLTVITGYSELILLRLQDNDELREDIAEIRKAGEQAAALTRQLLAFSRNQESQPQVLDLNVLVADNARMLRRLIGEDIELTTVADPTLGPIKADPVQIEQILLNLAVNARDAMPYGGRLVIETANVSLDADYTRRPVSVSPGPYVLLTVSDTGCGMDAETQSRIFEPFFTTKDPGKGTGLGLSTIYGIVQQNCGAIWVSSALDQGTTFKIYLPQFREPVGAAAPLATWRETPHGSETVLVVEDEEMVRDLAYEILLMQGYAVLTAADASAAIQLCEQHQGPIHLVITDAVMPRISGRELVQHLGHLRPTAKILYMSGYTGHAMLHHSVLDVNTPFLQKPFTPGALARKVREVLDAPRAA